MRELTGHKVNPANDLLTVSVLGEPGDGGANQYYEIVFPKPAEVNRPHLETVHLSFQDGPIPETGVNGITQEALIAICIDRLQGFQRGAFACRENALALTRLEEAQMWLHKRTRDRMARGVEGTHKE